jgi:hypothetical protein
MDIEDAVECIQDALIAKVDAIFGTDDTDEQNEM